MPKAQQDGDEPVEQAPEPVVVSDASRTFFYPPQDGREAFTCEAQNQTDADTQYIAAGSEK